MEPEAKLRIVKLVHTIIWAVFAGCIIAVPLFSYQKRLEVSTVLIAFVSLEVLVLVLNHMRCPLTNIAARYTSDRRDNFDIYLPVWLARQNKLIFGALFVAGSLYTFIVWLANRAAT